ncbi:MAG: hypothetical protein JXR97_10300, partial [Planctomycetes bacterium]|nr:hypothetical protein [Planctomycetota bacterium]
MFCALLAASIVRAESFSPNTSHLTIPENSSAQLVVTLNPTYFSTEQLDAEVTLIGSANVAIVGGIQSYAASASVRSWTIEVGTQSAGAESEVILRIQTVGVSGGANSAPPYDVNLTIGTSSSNPANPATQATVVNLETTKAINGFVINKVFLQPVRPKIFIKQAIQEQAVHDDTVPSAPVTPAAGNGQQSQATSGG